MNELQLSFFCANESSLALQVDISSAERLFCGCIFIILLDSSTDWRPLFCAVCHITFNSMKLSSVIFLYIVFMAKHINCWIYGFLIWPKRLPVTANPIVCRKSHIVYFIAINIELMPVRITRRCIMAPLSRLRKSIHTAMTDSNICVIPGHIKHICRTIFCVFTRLYFESYTHIQIRSLRNASHGLLSNLLVLFVRCSRVVIVIAPMLYMTKATQTEFETSILRKEKGITSKHTTLIVLPQYVCGVCSVLFYTHHHWIRIQEKKTCSNSKKIKTNNNNGKKDKTKNHRSETKLKIISSRVHAFTYIWKKTAPKNNQNKCERKRDSETINDI